MNDIIYFNLIVLFLSFHRLFSPTWVDFEKKIFYFTLMNLLVFTRVNQ